MSSYIYFDGSSSKGTRAISAHVFDQLVMLALNNIADISVSSKQMKKNQKIRLNRPVQTNIRRGIAHIKISVDIKKNLQVQQTCTSIQEEVVRVLMASAEQIPFDVRVKVDSIID